MKVFNIIWRIILSVLLAGICTAFLNWFFVRGLGDGVITIWGLFLIVFLGAVFASPLRKYLEYKD